MAHPTIGDHDLNKQNLTPPVDAWTQVTAYLTKIESTLSDKASKKLLHFLANWLLGRFLKNTDKYSLNPVQR